MNKKKNDQSAKRKIPIIQDELDLQNLVDILNDITKPQETITEKIIQDITHLKEKG